MIAYIKDDVLNDNKSFIQAVCIKYDGKYEPIEFLPLSSYNQSVNEPKPTVSKMESVDNYLCKWQKLKEWLKEIKVSSEKQMKEARINTDYYTRASVQNLAVERVLQQMQELEGEDE